MNNSSHSRRLTSLKMYEELQLAGDFVSDNKRIKAYLLCTACLLPLSHMPVVLMAIQQQNCDISQ